MRVICVLAVLVAASYAGDEFAGQGGVVQGYQQGSQDGPQISQQTGSPAGPQYSQQQPAFGSDFINNAFGPYGQQGGQSQFGKSNFGAATFGGGGQVNGLGGDIFANGGGFGATFGGGRDGATPFFRGRVQASTSDQHQSQADRRDEAAVRDARHQQAQIRRTDEQERQGDFLEADQNDWKGQDESRGRVQNDKYDQKAGLWKLNSRQQNDHNSKVAVGLAASGETQATGVDSSDSAKALGVKKTAFTNGNLGFEKIDYNFVKDFDQKAAERGGFQEVTGRDNNNEQTYQEKQRDHRTSNADSSNLRKANDVSRAAESAASQQNARQWKGLENQYGAADRQLDALGKKAEDFLTTSNKRDDRVWNADVAKDTAFRGAEDLASKNSLYNKNAVATAQGAKGVVDNKVYEGTETGQAGNPAYGWQEEGVQEAAPRGFTGDAQTAAQAYDDGRIALNGAAAQNIAGVSGPRVGESLNSYNAGPVAGAVAGQNGKARVEKSGGDIVNAYRENAIQGDLGNQLSNNNAESRANAANNYNRDRGLQDAIEANAAKEGKWAKQQEGFKDARQQGYQGDNANAAKDAEAVSNAALDKSSSSNLDEVNKSLEQAKLDRINLKSNAVRSNQNIKSKKQFYHDKTQGGFNNEGLNYNRNAGNNDFGAQESAQKEARTRGNRLQQTQKNNQEARRFEDADHRKISNGQQVYKNNNANKGNKLGYNSASDKANSASKGFNKNNSRQEFDRFQQLNNQQANKQWDQANRNWLTRGSGKNVGRQVQAAFDFNRNGFGRGRQGQGYNAGQLGTPRFGQTPLHLDQGQRGFYTSDNTGIPGSSFGSSGASFGSSRGVPQAAVGSGKEEGIIAPGALAAGNTQFGGQW